MFRGLLLLLSLQCLGEAIKVLTGVVIPGPVIGMLLMLALLMVRGGVPESLDTSTEWLLGRMPLLFTPPSVGLIFLVPSLGGEWGAVLAVAVPGTLLTLLFTAVLMQRLLAARRQPEHDQ